jgi:hypothetical protein
MLTYVADVFGHTLVVPPFVLNCLNIKVQRGFSFCKAGIYSYRRDNPDKPCVNLSEQSCISLSERYSCARAIFC